MAITDQQLLRAYKGIESEETHVHENPGHLLGLLRVATAVAISIGEDAEALQEKFNEA